MRTTQTPMPLSTQRHQPDPWLLAAGFFCLYALTIDTVQASPDEIFRVRMIENLLATGDPRLGTAHEFAKYSPLQSVLAVPFYLAGKVLGSWGGLSPANAGALGATLFCTFVAALTCAAFWYAVRDLLQISCHASAGAPPDPRASSEPDAVRLANWTTLIFGLTSPLWPYAKHFYAEPLNALLALTSIWLWARLWAAPSRAATCALFAATAAYGVNNPPALALWPAMALAIPWAPPHQRRRLGTMAVAGFGVALASAAGHNYWRLGSLWATGYSGDHGVPAALYDGSPGFATPLWVGLHGLLFTPGKSALLFFPLLVHGIAGLWAVRRAWTPFVVPALAFAGVLLATYAKWWAWYGGGCFGPRLLLPLAPVLSTGAAIAVMRAHVAWRTARDQGASAGRALRSFGALAGVVVWGVYVQVSGCLLSFGHDWMYWMTANYQNEYLEWYTPQFSPLVRHAAVAWKHPEEISMVLIEKRPQRLAVITLPEVPGPGYTRIRLTQSGVNSAYWWSVAELRAFARQGGRDVPLAAEAVAKALRASHKSEQLARLADGNLASRWSPEESRRPKHWIELRFDSPVAISRLELDTGPYHNDGPGGLEVGVQRPSGRFETLTARDGVRLTGAHPELALRWPALALLVGALTFWLMALAPGLLQWAARPRAFRASS